MKLVKSVKGNRFANVVAGDFSASRRSLFYARVFYELPVPGLLISLSSGNIIADANQLACSVLGHDASDLLGRSFTEIFDMDSDSITQILSQPPGREVESFLPRSQSLETFRLSTASDGNAFEPVCANVFSADDGEYLVLLFRSLTAELAADPPFPNGPGMVDPSTGLPNTLAAERKLDLLCSSLPLRSRDFAVTIFSIDGWRQSISGQSPRLADTLAQAIADRLRHRHGEGVFIARYRNDEFLVTLHDRPDYRTVLDEVRSDLSSEFVIHGLSFEFSVSAGMCIRNIWDAMHPEEMLSKARKAVERSRLEGGGRLVTYSDRMELRAKTASAVDEIIDGFRRGEFSLNFQPVVCLGTGQVEQAEALLRWDHPVKGPQRPADFLESLESLEVYDEVGLWVLDLALQTLERWAEKGISVRLCINLGADQLADETFIARALVVTGNYPRHLVEKLSIDILQMNRLSSMEDLIFSVERLANKGLGFSLDDFGLGDFGLFPDHLSAIDSIKINQSYVGGLDDDLGSIYIVQNIVEFASRHGLCVYAKGVETTQQYNLLRAMGCAGAQGFWISEARSEADFLCHLQQFSSVSLEDIPDVALAQKSQAFSFALTEHKLLLREMLNQTIGSQGNFSGRHSALEGLLKLLEHLESREKPVPDVDKLESAKTSVRRLLETVSVAVANPEPGKPCLLKQEIHLLSELIVILGEIMNQDLVSLSE